MCIRDRVSTVFIGLGYVFYAVGDFKYLGFTLVALYGWAMIISQLRYRITDQYTIDAGLLGPNETFSYTLFRAPKIFSY
ncbi:hypothetical protein ACQ4LD_21080, partial [Sphingobacterium daejeonense]